MLQLQLFPPSGSPHRGCSSGGNSRLHSEHPPSLISLYCFMFPTETAGREGALTLWTTVTCRCTLRWGCDGFLVPSLPSVGAPQLCPCLTVTPSASLLSAPCFIPCSPEGERGLESKSCLFSSSLPLSHHQLLPCAVEGSALSPVAFSLAGF